MVERRYRLPRTVLRTAAALAGCLQLAAGAAVASTPAPAVEPGEPPVAESPSSKASPEAAEQIAGAETTGAETTAVEQTAGKGTSRPNLIFILIDDARALELELGFGRSLPGWTSALETEIIDRGTTFDNFFNSTAYCCPSRASYLTGMYSHNHGIWGNNFNVSNGNGGWKRFWELGHEHQSLGPWMQAAGYQTVLVGKFLNQYPNKPSNFLPETYVPAGWDEWYGSFTNDLPFSYYEFRFNENGDVVEYGDTEPAYMTDVERAHAVDYLERYVPEDGPFFMFLSPFAPHGPIHVAPRHAGMHTHVDVDAPPSFNEVDVSDKPQFIQDIDFVYPAFWGNGWNDRLDMTLAVDELIQEVFDTLRARGLEDDTYVFFTSDNGLMWGEHRLSGKAVPYEEAIRFPLLVVGPDVPGPALRHELTLNVDIAPTLLELAGATIPESVDGESLVGLMRGDLDTANDWRDAALIELNLAGPSFGENEHEFIAGTEQVVPAYAGVRTLGHTYFEYETGEAELYDLIADPYQEDSLHESAPAAVVDALMTPLDALRSCTGSGCRDASRLGAPNARPRAVAASSCDHDLLRCNFDAIGSLDLDGNIVGYEWDFGDGNVDQGLVVWHDYATLGSYVVTLSVTDNEGEVGTLRLVVDPGATLLSDGFETGDTSAWDGGSAREPAPR